MKRKSLHFENLEVRAVLSASGVIAVEQVVSTETIIESSDDVHVQPAGQTTGSGSLSVLAGDFNFDGQVNATDIDMLCEVMRTQDRMDPRYDLTADGTINMSDMDMLIHDVLGTDYGDANLDRSIDAIDAAYIFENLFTKGAGWGAGDFTCDGVVDGLDFIVWNQNRGLIPLALSSGGGQENLTSEPETTPEPSIRVACNHQ